MESKKHNSKALMIGIIVVLFAFGIILGVGLLNNHDNENTDLDEEQNLYGDDYLGIDARVDEELKDYRNVLIYGIDNKHRSDIMMVFSINKNTNKVKLFSIYRDTYLKMNDDATLNFGGYEYKYFKCNHGYFKFGMANSMKTLNSQLDLNVHEAIAMDWDTIAKFVNQVGGIDVEVTDTMLPKLNDLIENPDDKLSSPGEYTLKGARAVAYLRTRKDADATVRSHRNEDVFMQLFKKAQKMSTSEKMELFDSIVDDVDTNMSRNTMVDTLAQISEFEIEPCDGWPYEYSIEWHKTGSYYFYVPKTLESNVVELHKIIFDQKDYTPTDKVKAISEEIKSTDELE